MTEAEASQKWCPMVRYMPVLGDSGDWALTNRGGDSRSENSCNCIGASCMAWRWTVTPNIMSGPPSISDSDGYCGAFER